MPENGFQPMERLDLYQEFVAVADQSWRAVEGWDAFHKGTIGRQLVRAVDRVCANLIEGGARQGDRESIYLFSVARGSAHEVIYWFDRARKQDLISGELHAALQLQLSEAIRKLSKLIAYRRSVAGCKVKEQRASYQGSSPIGDGFEYAAVDSHD